MWNPAFRTIAEQRGWQVHMFGKAGCPLMDLPTFSAQLHREYTECDRWRRVAMDRLVADPPRLVVVSMWRQYGLDGYPAGFSSYGEAWRAGLTRLVRQLREVGVKVLVLGPIPDPHSVVPVCLSDHLNDAAACAPARSIAVNASGIAAELAATTAGGGHYGDLTELFCTAARCPVIVGNTLVYLDENHLTIEYARLLTSAIGALVDRALAVS
ncbi:hypothetical protein C6A85_000000101185 [Mycobacterium sp. ITM-2017-0098]|nr:hypothetical protein C6A85_000000101185 [Mycobacterium sp. ITM-2017-0098]